MENQAELLQELAERIEGELLLDGIHQKLFATDASLYSEQPLGVVYPKTRQDLVTIVKTAGRLGIALIPRAAGTSLAGQCVGSGLVVDLSRHMTEIIEIDAEARQVRVQPGVILDVLNKKLEPYGLFFGPDTSTSNRCMIGGMIGNNSCGSHSILYGTTRDHVRAVEAVLADGSVVHWGDEEAPQDTQENSLEAKIRHHLSGLLDTKRERILEAFPKPEVKRRNMGYALDDLAQSARYVEGAHPYNLGRFLCGSEGTLALISEATLNLVPLPKEKMLLAVHFDTLDAALRATVLATQHQPAAIELMDRPIIEATAQNLEQSRNRDWLVGDPAAVLVIEFYRDTQEALDAAAQALIEDFKAKDFGYAFVPRHPPEMSRVWELRKAGLGLLMGVGGDLQSITLIEDTAVAVEDLPDYIRDFQQMLAGYDTECVYYAHASVGLLHLRPRLNPKLAEDVEKMRGIAHDTALLVKKYRGSISGEHGDGRLRAPLIAMMLGDEVNSILEEIKDTFDPQGIFNPHKIVRPLPFDRDFRAEPGKTPPLPTTHFSFREDGDLLRAVERCNGAGACRKLPEAGGTMCPSYHITLDERFTTRGRANVFRELLYGAETALDAVQDAELYEVLRLCLSCKACKSECPASVDMARLKAEFLQHYYDAHGAPLGVKLMGQPERGYALAQLFAKLSNFGTRLAPTKWLMKHFLGVDPRRDLPRFASKTLRRQLARRGLHPQTAPSQATNEAGQPRCLLYIDVFTDFNDTELGIAAYEVLQAAGYEVLITKHPSSARAQLSKGLVREAKAIAIANVKALAPFAKAGIPILGIEPSALLTLRDEVPDLVPAELREEADLIAAKAQLVHHFIGEQVAAGAVELPMDGQKRRLLVHGHCHEKALVGVAEIRKSLSAIPGFEVAMIPSGCCGMAGSFGFENYELSMGIGELVLFPAVRDREEDQILVAAGTSCRHQIHDGTQAQALHPIELIRSALVLKGDPKTLPAA